MLCFLNATLVQVSLRNATSFDPSFAYAAGPSSKGLSWYVTFPVTAGDAAHFLVSTENGRGSILASAGTLTGTDPTVSVAEAVKGGLQTRMVNALIIPNPLEITKEISFSVSWIRSSYIGQRR